MLSLRTFVCFQITLTVHESPDILLFLALISNIKRKGCDMKCLGRALAFLV